MLLSEDIIERYEAAIARQDWSAVDLREFVPSADAAGYGATLTELLRIRMEHQVATGIPDVLSRCVAEFPELQSQPAHLSLLAYEEYRLLKSAGVSVSPLQYSKQWRVDVAKWNLVSTEYHLTEADWLQATDNEATLARGAAGVVGARKPVACTGPRPRAVLTCGQVFGPFRILIELGSGALATVYLAQQLDLSERLVVLKVCSLATGEPQKIAQLQHPNIVQILSLHEVAGYQVLCMPYVGATTFADILIHSGQESTATASMLLSTTICVRQRDVQTLIDGTAPLAGKATRILSVDNAPWLERWRKLPYEQVACELLYQAARGLQHAHEQGIVHSDLKPANILLGDDGTARLVDFNVAQHAISPVNSRTVGGTLPYMAPEHLKSLMDSVWRAGPASDLYSLGIVAYQMFSGKLPFTNPTGPFRDVIEQCIKQRMTQSPNFAALRASTDLRSIIQKMLEPDLARRYPSADQLCEDLRRHTEHRPLKFAARRSPLQRIRKWAKRHPKLSSATTIGSLASACVLGVLFTSWTLQTSLHRQLATKQLAEFRAAAPEVFVTAASRRAFPEVHASLAEQINKLLDSLQLENQSTAEGCWQYIAANERTRLASDLLKLSNVIEREATAASEMQRASLNRAIEIDPTTASLAIIEDLKQLAHRIDSTIDDAPLAQTSLDELSQSLHAYQVGDYAPAIEQLQRSLTNDPNQPAAWLLLGHTFVSRSEFLFADHAYSSSLALLPNHWKAWYYRALANLEYAQSTQRADRFAEAAECFSRTIALRPALADAYYNRAICREHLGDIPGALEDANSIKEQERFAIVANLFCARLYTRLGRQDEAQASLKVAYRCLPVTANDFIELGNSRLSSDPQQSMLDLLAAHRLRPGTISVLQNLAYLSMEVVPDPKIADLIVNAWVASAPNSAVAMASRAVFHARQSHLEAAIDDAQAASKLLPSAREWAQIASAYALVARESQDAQQAKPMRDQAFKLLATALQSDWRLAAEVSRDSDLLTLGEDPRFSILLGSAATLSQLPKMAQDAAEKSTTVSKPE